MNARTLAHEAHTVFPVVAEPPVETSSDATSVWDRIDAVAERHRQRALASGAGEVGTAAFDPSAWEAVGRRVHSEAGWLILCTAAGAVLEAARRLVLGRTQ